jgi:hypothetical protein
VAIQAVLKPRFGVTEGSHLLTDVEIIHYLDFALQPALFNADLCWLFVHVCRAIQAWFHRTIERSKTPTGAVVEYAGGFVNVVVAIATEPNFLSVSQPFARVIRKFAHNSGGLITPCAASFAAQLRTGPVPDCWAAAGYLLNRQPDALTADLSGLIGMHFEANEEGLAQVIAVLSMIAVSRPTNTDLQAAIAEFLVGIRQAWDGHDEVVGLAFRALELVGGGRLDAFLRMLNFENLGVRAIASMALVAAGLANNDSVKKNEQVKATLNSTQPSMIEKLVEVMTGAIGFIREAAPGSDDFRVVKRLVTAFFKYLTAIIKLNGQATVLSEQLVNFINYLAQHMYKSPRLFVPYARMLYEMVDATQDRVEFT